MLKKILENVHIKLLALFLACILWVHVTTENVYEKKLHIPLNVDNLSQGFVISSPVPGWVDVDVRAKGKQLIMLKWHDLKCVADFKNAMDGNFKYQLEPGNVKIPDKLGVEVLRISNPNILTCQIEKKIVRSAAIKPRINGSPEKGFIFLKPISMNPRAVRVEGPKSEVDKIDSLETVVISLDKKIESFTQTVAVAAPPDLTLEIIPDSVKVNVIIEKISQRTLSDIKVKPVNVARNAQIIIEPEIVSLTFAGPKRFLDRINPASVEVTLDIENMSEGIYFCLAEIPVFENVEFVSSNPEKFKVIIKGGA